MPSVSTGDNGVMSLEAEIEGLKARMDGLETAVQTLIEALTARPGFEGLLDKRAPVGGRGISECRVN